MRTALHQHAWTESLLDAPAGRRLAPFVRRSHGLTVLHSPGELPCVIDERAEAMARWVGPAQLVHGSDRPVIEPVPTGREVKLMNSSAARLTPVRALA